MAEPEDGGDGGSLLTRRIGPLPTWQWLAVITLAGLAYYVLVARKKTAAATSSTSTTSPTTSSADVPQFVIQNTFPSPPMTPAANNITVNVPDQDTQAPPTPTNPVSPVRRGPALPLPAPTTPVHQTLPAKIGKTVTVTKWTAKNAPWSSTISGIAAQSGIKNWQTVWNAPQNAALRAQRKKPELIQPGDKVYVPAA